MVLHQQLTQQVALQTADTQLLLLQQMLQVVLQIADISAPAQAQAVDATSGASEH